MNDVCRMAWKASERFAEPKDFARDPWKTEDTIQVEGTELWYAVFHFKDCLLSVTKLLGSWLCGLLLLVKVWFVMLKS